MSCFNCYSARKIDSDLIDKVLERGHKLRSCMVQSILNNDPLNPDVINLQEKKVKLDELSQETNDKIKAFLQGDAMSRQEEIATLETLRSMSATDLCRATDRTYRSEEPCDCFTCFEYGEKDLKCDLKRGNEITQKIQEKYRNEATNYLKFVDSVKISIHSVVLNEAGDKKVLGSLVKDKASGVGQTFFLEYQIPEVLTRNHQKNKGKVDSGLDFGNVVRLCARRSQSQGITFKQTSVHDVSNLNRVNLQEAVIIFKLSFRNFKQKQPISLGVAKFSFSSFEVNKNFTCNHELTLRLNENNPIVVGGLKVSIQLGCGRLYFGKEFIDAIINDKENSIALGSDDQSSNDSEITDKVEELYTSCFSGKLEKIVPQQSRSQFFEPFIPKLKLATQKTNNKKLQPVSAPQTQKPVSTVHTQKPNSAPGPIKPNSALKKLDSGTREPVRFVSTSRKLEPVTQESIKSDSGHRKLEPPTQEPTRPVLFGFIYISEAQFSREVMNSYLTCQIFTTDEVINSKLVAFDSNPIYNFSQQVPLICDEELLQSLRDNFMVVEFFEKEQDKNFLIGLCKLHLHQFYLAYRNPVIVKYLNERKLPVIGTDGWESIFTPVDGEVVGQVQVLVAVGTKEQIDNLENERGFKKNSVKAIIETRKPKTKQTIDASTQSVMDPPKNLEDLLNQIVAQKQHSDTGTNTSPLHVETSTNTEPQVRSTSDLLDTLHKALAIDLSEKNYFKAQVLINSALHLPSRRKCKSKKSKGRNGKHEDILPSTYVTFVNYKEELIVTPIVPRCTSPKWDFRCEVALPIAYLNDNQKFLVFKIWRKSTNTTMTPNMQVDHVIGFATVDLTVLSAGLPSVQGWFNINDLSKKCNGQINIHVTPLENVTKYHSQNCCSVENTTSPQLDEASLFEPNELLGRALKRKFSELDEITQRLRLRLSKVTNDESETSNDEIADEFERDINTLCVEDDFDMVNFEKEARSFNMAHIKDVGLLQTDQHLSESKQKIGLLLEKLSLVSGETSSRYVSGCSDVREDAETIFNELDKSSRPNLHNTDSFIREMSEKFGSVLSECRSGPEGEGNQTKRD